MNELGKLLKELRGKKPLRAIAENTGLSHSYISDIEKGFRRGTKVPIHPSPDTLKRLAQAYNFPYEELMKVAGYIEEEDKKEINTYDSLSEINKLVKKYGIEQMGFFDIEEWKNLSPDDLLLLEEQFKLIVKLAKQRNERNEEK
jgi:transcriptional regulator with XRE-family HTH domain